MCVPACAGACLSVLYTSVLIENCAVRQADCLKLNFAFTFSITFLINPLNGNSAGKSDKMPKCNIKGRLKKASKSRRRLETLKMFAAFLSLYLNVGINKKQWV